MDWLKKNYDRVILMVVAGLTIWLAISFITKAGAFAENFTVARQEPTELLPENRQPEVEAGTSALRSKAMWVNPLVNESRPSLYLSAPIVEKDGEVYDMSKEDRLLRPPASNQWLVENGLEFLKPDVLSRDPDSDGFNNLEEWEGKTEPDLAAQHPSRLVKLDFLRRKSYDYILEFTSRNDPKYGINRRFPTAKSWFVEVGETFDEDRFRLDAFEEKFGVSKFGTKEDQSILKITDLQKNQKFDLVRKIRKNLPTYAAIFRFSLGGAEEFEVKQAETFQLPGVDSATYKLIDIEETVAIISDVLPPGSATEPTLTRLEKKAE